MIQVGVDLVKHFESYSSAPYLCPAGVWTIGWGTTRYPNGRRVTAHDKPCSRKDAEYWLHHELNKAERVVTDYCTAELNEYQRAALISFVYNLGAGAFIASTLRRRLNTGEFDDVPYQLSRWNKAGGRILRGLIRRRKAEIKLWETRTNG